MYVLTSSLAGLVVFFSLVETFISYHNRGQSSNLISREILQVSMTYAESETNDTNYCINERHTFSAFRKTDIC